MLDAYLETVFADCRHSEADLFDEQREAIDFLWEHPFSALYLDVGKGKTVISLSIIDRLWLRGYRGKFLIVAPIRVAARVWPYEPRLWRQLAYMGSTLIRVEDDDRRLKAAYDHGYQHGKARGYKSAMCQAIANRMATARKYELLRELLNSDEPIHIINKEAVDWLVNEYAERSQWPYKVVFIDEASVLGDHNNVIFKALLRVRPHIKRFHELTASPASQSYMRFFSQIYLLDQGERFGTHITPFRERYFTYNPWARTWKLRPGADQEIERLIADICLVMRSDKDIQVNIRPIRLPKPLMDDYRQFEADLVLELPDDKVIDAVNGAVLSNKLLQFASGAVYDREVELDEFGEPVLDKRGIPKLKRFYHLLHDEKIEELRSLLDETLDHPIIVAYWYQSSLDRLRKAFPKAGVMDREGKIVDDWNKRKYKMLLVHPRSAGHGLNMQFGGHHIALFDIFWPLDLFIQIIGRLRPRDKARPEVNTGQTETVMVHLLSAVGTMDETVAANLQFLRNTEDAMFKRLTALRRKLKNVR